MKKAILIHGWDSNPEKDFYPWLKEKLKKEGIELEIPRMSESETPKIKGWVDYMKTLDINSETLLIGHSIGCQTIIRYLENTGKEISKAVFIAGWFTLIGLETEEEKQIAKPWLETKIDFKKVKIKKSIALFSDNDPYVTLENLELFEKNLNSEIVIEENRGHFTEKEEPAVLREIVRLIKK